MSDKHFYIVCFTPKIRVCQFPIVLQLLLKIRILKNKFTFVPSIYLSFKCFKYIHKYFVVQSFFERKNFLRKFFQKKIQKNKKTQKKISDTKIAEIFDCLFCKIRLVSRKKLLSGQYSTRGTFRSQEYSLYCFINFMKKNSSKHLPQLPFFFCCCWGKNIISLNHLDMWLKRFEKTCSVLNTFKNKKKFFVV